MQYSLQTQANSYSPLSTWLKRIAAAALILANLVIVVLALKDQWGFLQILYICWFEAIIIGAYTLLKMLVVILFGHPFGRRLGARLSYENRMALGFYGLIALGFFVVKFAGFALGTGFLLLLVPSWLEQLETGQRVVSSHPAMLTHDGFQAVLSSLPIILAGLAISHGISFIVNFLCRREYQRANILVLLFWPYARLGLVIAVMIIAGLAAAIAPPLTRTTTFAIAVVGLKLVADLASHAFEHSRKPAVPPIIPVAEGSRGGGQGGPSRKRLHLSLRAQATHDLRQPRIAAPSPISAATPAPPVITAPG